MTKKIENIHALLNELLMGDDYTTVDELSEVLDVSPRTIHNYLNSSEFSSIIKNSELDRRPNQGIKLNLSKKRENEIHSKLQTNTYIQLYKSNYDDFSFVIMHLLKARNYLNFTFIKKQLFISSSSIQAITENLKKFFAKFNCELIYFKNKGLKIVGSESDIRSLFLFFLTNYMAITHTNSQKGRLTHKTEQIIDTFFNQNEKDDLCALIEHYEKTLQSRVCENDYNLLLLYLMIIIIRIKSGHNTKEAMNSKIENSREYQYAVMLKFHIERLFTIEFPPEELNYITKILMSVRLQTNVANGSIEENVIESFLQIISTRLNIDLTMDAELSKNLHTHIRPAINRMKQGIPFSNPLLNHIKNDYTEVYLSVLTTIEYIEKNENIYFDSNEIGYICLHIIAAINRPKNRHSIKTILICTEGLSIEMYLKNKIESSFKEIDIVNIYRTDDSDSLNPSQYDLIINSTRTEITCKNTVSISPLFSDDDYNRIKHHILFKQATKQFERDDLFKYLTTVRKRYTSQHDFISENCQFLNERGYVSDTFYQSVVKRINKSSTYVARNIAVIHGSKEEVLKDRVMIVNLEKSIIWEGYTVKTVIFIVTKVENSNLFIHLLRQIMRIASSDHLAHKLHSCDNNIDVLNLLEKVR